MTIATASIDQNTIRRRGTGLRAYNPDKVFKGYTLFTPLTGNGEVYLLNLEGEVVHQWNLPYPPGLYGYLLPNGNLFYNGKTPEIPPRFPLWGAFKGGVVLEVDPQGNIIWEYKHPDHHHDGRRLRNGNTILLALEKIPQSLIPRIKGGVPGTEADGDIYADVLYEVTPGGEIVWTWHAYEHLDPDIFTITPQDQRHEWTHGNTVGELADGNIVVSFRNISTVAIIDRHTEEIIWTLGDDVLAQQHFPNELANGNILIFDNGAHRRHAALNYSRVIEVNRQTKEIVWEYADNPPHNFFSSYISGAQRLGNGNTLITEGAFGRIFEVTVNSEIVWEYVNPHFAVRNILGDNSAVARGEQNSVFRAFRYAPEEVPWL
ncbi:aryl-sulfate sulfotransferase [Nostoc parmelioides]|uniref:Aryl-sulfate sulfotransferase n=1 Tax=Nostoc parmelioides FACHB-3921 TaxID=2692909 RepID=A0ABR8B7Y4_9NOSO|nr:aryl-sulfate sulfotransferase [Nostoc parmelioides]MBD2249966.1 aryl-sulfate sulfotransferase [Nostoc parmelioides FACHB-3921]